MQLIYDDFVSLKTSLEEPFKKMAQIVFEHLNIKESYEVDVVISDEKMIQDINREYRNIDKVTDVISFAFLDDKEPSHQIKGEDIDIMLGQIIICAKRAQEQADEIGHSLEREMLFLFLHGLLHLLGYDHMVKEDEEVMFSLQKVLLNKFEETYGSL